MAFPEALSFSLRRRDTGPNSKNFWVFLIGLEVTLSYMIYIPYGLFKDDFWVECPLFCGIAQDFDFKKLCIVSKFILNTGDYPPPLIKR